MNAGNTRWYPPNSFLIRQRVGGLLKWM